MPGPVSDSAPGPSDGSPLDTPICIVFNNVDPSSLVFVEVEDADGKGVSVGEWEDGEPYAKLVITPRSILKGLGIADDFEVLRCAFCGFEYVGPDPAPREDLEAHIRICPDHPARELVRFLNTLTRATVEAMPLDTQARLVKLVMNWHPTGAFPKVVMDQLVTTEPMDESPST